MDGAETRFGYEGTREEFVERLLCEAPLGSITKWEHTEREEEYKIIVLLAAKLGQEHESVEACSTLIP